MTMERFQHIADDLKLILGVLETVTLDEWEEFVKLAHGDMDLVRAMHNASAPAEQAKCAVQVAAHVLTLKRAITAIKTGYYTVWGKEPRL